MSLQEAPQRRSQSRFDLPGFGLPLNFRPNGDHLPDFFEGNDPCLYPSYVDSGDEPTLKLKTLREINMMRFMNQITDKHDWFIKVADDIICAKWKAEILSENNQMLNSGGFSEPMFDWCIAELQRDAQKFNANGAVHAFDCILKADSAISQDLRQDLINAVKPLEDVSSKQQDWHPGSNEKVLDLVHPSLFPLVYGRSKILPDSITDLENYIAKSGSGVVVPVPAEGEALGVHYSSFLRNLYSRKFQWLPCEVDVASELKITSYINNLHHSNKALYATLEKILQQILPLWDEMLFDLVKAVDVENESRISYEEIDIVDDEPEPEQDSYGSLQDWEAATDNWWNRTRNVVQPEPKKFYSTFRTDRSDFVNLKTKFGNRGLQVIVKLANIHLTPEKPNYEGGTWHVEGQLNEHICGTAIYYYDVDNITQSTLSFRQQCIPDEFEDIGYEQSEHSFLEQVYGCENDTQALQDLGPVLTKEGRVIVFPNVYQHRVDPFQLQDPTRPGHRKILAFFLVDPHIRVISTANVPCQRRDWWAEVITNQAGSDKLTLLPTELKQAIVDEVDFPMSLEDAKALRLELIEERKTFLQVHERVASGHTFSLCEH